jgi:hypothetical protein
MGVPAIIKGFSSGKSPEPVDRMREALEENTQSQLKMIEQFRHNNGLFVSLGSKVDLMNEHLKDIERHQVSMVSELIRSNKSH